MSKHTQGEVELNAAGDILQGLNDSANQGAVIAIFHGPEALANAVHAKMIWNDYDCLVVSLRAAVGNAHVRRDLTKRAYGYEPNEIWLPVAEALLAEIAAQTSEDDKCK